MTSVVSCFTVAVWRTNRDSPRQQPTSPKQWGIKWSEAFCTDPTHTFIPPERTEVFFGWLIDRCADESPVHPPCHSYLETSVRV
ncbi:hypothetical protein ZHAS_00020238 [Anopheles sinensis]|uniref:Uncharacterized protein n=1 Tax=Anopheles sinensis TaxID=74873 RepID=A0A084WPA9_ANOSI|nr:hypothetical protein ZHAS_00020238 [Anopheles sinensis]